MMNSRAGASRRAFQVSVVVSIDRDVSLSRGCACRNALSSSSQTKHSFVRKELQNNNNQLEYVSNQFALACRVFYSFESPMIR